MNISPQVGHQKIEQRIRTLRMLWMATIGSVFLYYFFTIYVGGPENRTSNSLLSLVLVVVGLLATLISIPVKRKLLKGAINQQRVDLVQPGYILAWAVAEVSAILGILDFFATGNRYYFVPFLIAVFGQLIHYPKRQHVIDASISKWQAIDSPQNPRMS